MSLVLSKLNETITHWPNAGSDGYGGFTWGTPVTMNGRWSLTQVLFKTPTGVELLSNSIVYTEDDIAVGDYLALGDLTTTADPTTTALTWEVKQFTRNTDLQNLESLRKAFL